MKTTYTLSPLMTDFCHLDDELQNLNPVCLDILAKRGFSTNNQMRDVLFPSIKQALKPLRCKDIKEAVLLLAEAIESKRPIVVYRDYDVDGITAGATAVECLSNLGAEVHHYVNLREVDGFGICKNGIDNILKQWPETQIILTVDNGINGVDAVRYANERGLTVCVTDHHEPGPELPPAAAVVDLKRKDEVYPYHDLCGCGLIFRIMLDLYRYLKVDPTPVVNCLDMVALASVADVVPLLGENRALVREGILRIEAGIRPFFASMLRLYEVDDVNAHYTLGFQIAPTLNALSRLGEDTGLAVEALISRDSDWVNLQCISFIESNKKRKQLTQEQVDIAMKLAETQKNDPALVIFSESFSEGIVGIIAGRLKEQFWKPAIVLAKDASGNMKGSARSIDEVHLLDALNACAKHLTTYGGHKKAAGISLKAESFEAFRESLNVYVNSLLAGEEVTKKIPLATVLTESTLTESLVHDLRILEPYGEGFPEPLFGLKACPDQVCYMGVDEQHVKFNCSNSGTSIILWNQGKKYKGRKNLPTKFVGKPKLNLWNGTVSVQFIAD